MCLRDFFRLFLVDLCETDIAIYAIPCTLTHTQRLCPFCSAQSAIKRHFSIFCSHFPGCKFSKSYWQNTCYWSHNKQSLSQTTIDIAVLLHSPFYINKCERVNVLESGMLALKMWFYCIRFERIFTLFPNIFIFHRYQNGNVSSRMCKHSKVDFPYFIWLSEIKCINVDQWKLHMRTSNSFVSEIPEYRHWFQDLTAIETVLSYQSRFLFSPLVLLFEWNGSGAVWMLLRIHFWFILIRLCFFGIIPILLWRWLERFRAVDSISPASYPMRTQWLNSEFFRFYSFVHFFRVRTQRVWVCVRVCVSTWSLDSH